MTEWSIMGNVADGGEGNRGNAALRPAANADQTAQAWSWWETYIVSNG